MNNFYLIGDSTVAKFNDVTYYYSRFGYGTKLDNYFKDLNIINLALSGRSSKSFLKEENYTYFLNHVSKGDYLLLGFGHNDEKFDDPARFTNANLDLDDPNSFKYYLYNYYIKVAQEKGCKVILATPIVRLNRDNIYKGVEIHDTPNGNYNKAIIELADKLNLLCIDLTKMTLDYVKERGYNNSALTHAITNGKKENDKIVPDLLTTDNTHLNEFGADLVAYFVAISVKNSLSPLKKYLKDDIKMPLLSSLKINPTFIYKEYKVPDLKNYKPPYQFDTKTDNIYGTAFGNTNGVPNDPEIGYYACKDDDKYLVGQNSNILNGKIQTSGDAFAFLFKQISSNKNFYIEGNIKIKSFKLTKDAAFGLMLRDDCYINQEEENYTIATNYIACGMLTADKSTYINFSRENPANIKKYNTMDGFYEENDNIFVSLKRVGQAVDIHLSYKNKNYDQNFVDFDLINKDNNYMYLGFFATKGTLILIDNIKFEILGDAIEA